MILDDVTLQMPLRIELFRAEDASVMSREPDVLRLDVAADVGLAGTDLAAALAAPPVVARGLNVAVDQFVVVWK